MYYYRLISSMLKAVISTLGTSLYAVYKAESNANDSLLNYNGTPMGGLTYTAGKSGNAFTFNGTTAYVSLPNDSFNSLTGDFSVSMWVNTVNTGGTQGLFSNFAYDGSLLYGVVISNFGNTRVTIFNGTGAGITLQESLVNPYNTWYMVTVTRKASTGTKIYYNGTLSASNTSTTNPVYSSGNIRPAIGAYNYGPLFSNLVQYYAGNGTKIDELNVWSKELTSTEITELYNTGTGKFYPY